MEYPDEDTFLVIFYNSINKQTGRSFDYFPSQNVVFHKKSIELKYLFGSQFRKKSRIRETRLMSMEDLTIELL